MAATGVDNAPETARKTRVFLSYSRKDKAFTERLAQALTARGYKVDYDQTDHDPRFVETGISAEDEWWKRLQQLIAGAETMVFVVSPNSAASAVCDEEIGYARTLGKRIIPILHQRIDFAKAPQRLAALNVKLSFENTGAFEESLAALCNALDIDVAWHREGARLMALASKWDQDGRPDSQLLSAGAIAEADAWATRRPSNAPAPGELLLAFLDTGRRKAAADSDRLLGSIGRAHIKPALQALTEGRHDAALRLAAAGIVASDDLTLRLAPELGAIIGAAASNTRLRAVLHGHEEAVEVAAFSPDGARVATAGRDATARVWDASSGRETAVLRCEKGDDGLRASLVSVAFSKDSKRVLTGQLAGSAQIWDAENGRLLSTLRGFVGRVAFASNDERVISNVGEIWDVRSKHRVAKLAGKSDAGIARVSADGRHVFLARHGETAGVWDADTGRRIATFQQGHIELAALNSDGSRALTATPEAATVWDAASGAKLAVAATGGRQIFAVAVSANGTHIAAGTASGASYDVLVWEASTARLISTLSGHAEVVRSLEFSPDGARLLSAADDGTARLWDVATGLEIVALRGHQEPLSSASFSSDGTRIVTASQDGAARIWDAANDYLSTVLVFDSGVYDASFSADGGRLVTATEAGAAQVWDTATWRPLAAVRGKRAMTGAAFSPEAGRILTVSTDGARVWEADGARRAGGIEWQNEADEQLRPIQRACFGPDASRLVIVSGGVAQLWDMRAAGLLAEYRADQGWLRDAAISPDGKLVAAVGAHGFVRIWRIADGRELVTMRHEDGWQEASMPDGTPLVKPAEGDVDRVRFSPDGSRLLTVKDFSRTVDLWETDSGRHLDRLPLNSAWFSPNGSRIAGEISVRKERYQGETFAARVIDARSKRELMELDQHTMRISRIAFSPDGMRMVTASHDKTVKVFDVSRLPALAGDPVEVLAACLANGCGRRTKAEQADMLMQSAPDDLYEALVAPMSAEQRASIARRETILSRRLHGDCYLAPRQGPGWVRPVVREEARAAPPASTPPAQARTRAPRRRQNHLGLVLLIALALIAAAAFALVQFGVIALG